MTQHVITILIEDDDAPSSDEELEEFLESFDDWWDDERRVSRSRRGIHLVRFRSAGLAP